MTRITYVGELGWEILVPTELVAGVFDASPPATAWPALAGYHAMNAALERPIGLGADITPDETPLEAGLASA